MADEYNFVLESGERIPFKCALLKYFRSMETMVKDLALEDPLETPLPLPPYITKPVIAWCVLDAQHARRNKPPNKVHGNNLLFLLAVCRAQDYLDAPLLLTRSLDILYSALRQLPRNDLENLLRQEDITVPLIYVHTLPLTPYYEREQLIYTYLHKVLPHGVARPMLPVQQYVNPVASSDTHTLFLTAKGLYGLGSNRYGELVIDRDLLLSESRPSPISTPAGIPLFVKCGNHISFCATSKGLYVCGSNIHRQMGSESCVTTERWQLVGVTGEVLLVEVGRYHTVVLTTEGLYVCGQNKFGQLGTGCIQERAYMQRIDVEGDVIALACGENHTMVLTTTGLYGTGRVPSLEEAYTTRLTKRNWITTPQDIIGLAASGDTTVVLTSNAVYHSSYFVLNRKQLKAWPLPSEVTPRSVLLHKLCLLVLGQQGMVCEFAVPFKTKAPFCQTQQYWPIQFFTSHEEMVYFVSDDAVYRAHAGLRHLHKHLHVLDLNYSE